jgi:hypothetical protein
MSVYARIAANAVELFTPPEGLEISACFVPEIAQRSSLYRPRFRLKWVERTTARHSRHRLRSLTHRLI